MRLIDCSMDELDLIIKDKVIVPYGSGAWLAGMEINEFLPYKENVEYVIDQKEKRVCYIFGRRYSTKAPAFLKKEKRNIVVVLTSPIYQYEMVKELKEMDLPDTVTIVSPPFLSLDVNHTSSKDSINTTLGTKDYMIPKEIHSFWFSGDEKPEEYKRCIDTWYQKCKDYKIIEWNQKDYDCEKHPFLKRAIELKNWAYATDYARLDVIYRYGGIYMDMDVEVIKSFDELLNNEAVFGFSNRLFIDTAVFAAHKHSVVIKKVLDLYDEVESPTDRAGFKKYFAPAFARKVFADEGVIFDGSSQRLENMLVLSPTYFFPLEVVTFNTKNITADTCTIHYNNFGWGETNDMRKRKEENNRLLKKMFNEGNTL